MNKKTLLFCCLFIFLVVCHHKQSLAQQNERKKEQLSITINNGDTTVNGKNFKDISEEERVEWRKKFDGIHFKQEGISTTSPHSRNMRIYKKMEGDAMVLDTNKMRFYSFNDDAAPMHFEFHPDSLKNRLKFFGDKDSAMRMFRRRSDAAIDWKMVHPRRTPDMNVIPRFRDGMSDRRMARPSVPNSNSYSFSTTDKDGYTTNFDISIYDPSKADLKKVFHLEDLTSDILPISDLVFYPNFSSGETSLSFNTAAKGTIAVKLMDSSGNMIFSEKRALTGKNYTKQFSWAKNGIYYLKVSQAGKIYIKKIVKN